MTEILLSEEKDPAPDKPAPPVKIPPDLPTEPPIEEPPDNPGDPLEEEPPIEEPPDNPGDPSEEEPPIEDPPPPKLRRDSNNSETGAATYTTDRHSLNKYQLAAITTSL